jgi:thiol-disulfide isomerase/thioredoxin
MKNKFLVLAGGVALALAVILYNKYRVAKEIDLQALSLTDLSGHQVKLEDFRDKKLFITFFATWCGPCLQEMESLEKAQAILEKENFEFVLISDEPVSHLQEFKEQADIQLLILHSQRKLGDERIYTLPTSYLLNSKKKIVFDKVGAAEWEEPEIIATLRTLAK